MLIDSSIIEYFSNEMIFAKINAESADSLVAQKYNVSGFPTFVLTDSKGVEVDRIIGFREAAEFLETLNNYKNGIGTLDALLVEAETSTDRVLFFEIGNKYKYNGGKDEAKIWFQKVIDAGAKTDSLSGESRFSLADMFRRDENFDEAIGAFKAIKKDFRGTMFAEGADIYTAICYKYKGDTTSAISSFESFVKEYPDSEDVAWAKEQITKLK